MGTIKKTFPWIFIAVIFILITLTVVLLNFDLLVSVSALTLFLIFAVCVTKRRFPRIVTWPAGALREKLVGGFVVSFFAGLIMVFLGISVLTGGYAYGNLGVFFGILIIAGCFITLLLSPEIGGLIVMISSALSILFPYHPRLYSIAFPIMGIFGGLLVMANKWVRKFRDSGLSLAALIILALFSLLLSARIFSVGAWAKAPPVISTFVYGALCLAFTVSLIIGFKVKTLWWIPASFLASAIIGFILNSISVYLYNLWNPITYYGGDWDGSLSGLASMFFIFLMALLTALYGATGGALGIVISDLRRAKTIKGQDQ